MHESALLNGRLFFQTYVVPLGAVSVVDIGSLNVNGSLREVCPSPAKYIGVDFAEGSGVDMVLSDPYSLPFEAASIDVVVSSSCFEHSEMFWLSFAEVMRVLRPTGVFFLSAPSNGEFHRYPVDCWRFYPDAGRALVGWARRCGFNAALLESYVSRQHQSFWNDFVAVFLKDENEIGRYPQRILDAYRGFENGVVHGRDEILNPMRLPQDIRRQLELATQLKGRAPPTHPAPDQVPGLR